LSGVNRRAAAARASSRTLDYETDPSRGIVVAFGVFVVAVALVPTTIVVAQWLSWHPGDPPLHTAPESAIFGAALGLWGVLVATRHCRVTVDADARTMTWTMFAFGRAYRKVTWPFSDVTSIEIVSNGGVRPSGCSALASGPRGTRALITYFHGRHSPPRAVGDTARLVGIQLTR
jgi:hypothetical protein